MTEPFPTEPQLFEVYAATLEVLMKCLLISVVVLFVATIILIILCCWEETRNKPPVRTGMKPEADSKPVPTPLRQRRLKFHPWLSRARLLPWLCLGLLAWSFKAPVAYCSEPPEHRVPLGLDEFIPVPEDNPRTAAKIELGRQLFFDKQLSRDGTLACASCHQPERAFASDGKVATGIDNRRGTRNAPTLLNRAYGQSFFWDGRAQSLEAQALEPIQNPKEMDLSLQEFEVRLKRTEEYFPAFTAVFGEGPNARNAAKALATFVRTLLSGNSPFDRFEHGDQNALSPAAKHGLQLFRSKGNCIACHSGPLLSDEDFHNTGVSWGKEPHDYGRFEITHREQDRGKFKAPTLRNVAQTAPYMHNGNLATLDEVIEFYSQGGGLNPHLDREIRPLNLSANEKRELVEFLLSLSGNPLSSPPR